MNLDTRTAGAWLDLAGRHGTAALIVGGLVVGLLLLLARLARNQRRRSAALTFAAAGIALGFSAEGMWEVATGALHLAKWQAVLLFAFAEILMLFEADQARKKIAEERDPSRHIRAVWVIAAVAALAAASYADNMSGQVVRFFMPMAVAWQWASRIKDDLPDAVKQESKWIWTPQRIGVRLGLLKPGSVDDLSEVFRQRRVSALVDAGVDLYAERQAAKLRGDAPAGRSWWPRRDRLAAASRRMQRLAKAAAREDVAAAREQLRLTFSIEHVLLGRSGEVDDWTRQQLDTARSSASQASRRLRSQHHLARGHALPPRALPAATVELGGIRMPAHLAAQIGEPPAQWPAHSGGELGALIDVTAEPAPDPRREPEADSPKSAATAQRPARRSVTQAVREPAQKSDDKKLAQAYARLTRKLGREPSGPELGEAAGVSKATANRWKAGRTPASPAAPTTNHERKPRA